MSFMLDERHFHTLTAFSHASAINLLPEHATGEARGMSRAIWSMAILGLALLSRPDTAMAAEIKIFTTRAVATVLDKVGPEFERTTGHRLNITIDIAVRMAQRVQAGEPFDILVAAPGQIDELIKSGKITPNTRANLVRSGIGVEVRAGAAKPDISSVGAFKRTLLNAKSIAYLKEGQSGIYVARMIERLGIAEAINSKVTRPETDIVSELVAKGDIELGMVVITQIMTTQGVELVGPLPPEIQTYITFSAGVSAASRAPDAARELIRFLKGPVALPVIKAQGMEPVR
jgi:molybdate transport system substrate-binding protein